MQVVHERCCGLDVHKNKVVACLLTPDSGGKVQRELRSFGTMTDELLAMMDWLVSKGCTHVAMESTGVYWKPIYNLLEVTLEIIVVNAQHMKAVPGRKTDVHDAEWIADLLRHGLLRASFIPSRPQRELRELTRYRTSLLQERAAEVNRIQKVLEGANIKLGSVATDVMGVSGRAMLEALVAGDAEPSAIADLAKGRLRGKLPQLQRALSGRIQAHQRFLLAEQLSHVDALEASIQRVSAEIGERMRLFEEDLRRLQTIPGVARRTGEALLAELGSDMTRFPNAGHLASWAGMCPGHNESAGKRKSGTTRKGSPWLRATLTEAAWGASHSKNTYLSAQYHRLSARRGRKRAIIATGHSILVIVYHVLKRQQEYADLGSNYFDERDPEAVARRLIRRLEKLGKKVTIEPNGVPTQAA